MSDIEKLKEENDRLRQIIEITIRELEREQNAPIVYGHRIDSLIKKIRDSLEVLPELK